MSKIPQGIDVLGQRREHGRVNEDVRLTDNPENGNPAPTLPALWGISLKYISLATLAVQNSMLTIIMHYSRVSTPPNRTYSAATAVLMNEIFKGLISLSIAFYRIEAGNASSLSIRSSLWRMKRLYREVFGFDCWKLSIPAVLYVIQNNLQYVAVSNLEAATFQVSYQMKILTTAAFSVLLLRRRLASFQWLALLLLAIGVGIVQISSNAAKATSTTSTTSPVVHATMNPMKGFLAVSIACVISGLSGVYFELVLKGSNTDLWVRNVQLAFFSLVPAIVPIVFSQSTVIVGEPKERGWFDTLFENFGPWAWATIANQVIGGLTAALVIKYADNILKGFATSLSILFSFLASIALFNFQFTFVFLVGATVVLLATWLFNSPKKTASATGATMNAGWMDKLRLWGGSPMSNMDTNGRSDYLPLAGMSSDSIPSFANAHTVPSLSSPLTLVNGKYPK